MASMLGILSRLRVDFARKGVVGNIRMSWSSCVGPSDIAPRCLGSVRERRLCSSPAEEEIVLFVMPSLRAFQLISRFKILHLGLMGVSLTPLIDSYVNSNPQWLEQFQWKFAVGSVFTLFALMLASVYISRVVGQILYYPKDREILVTTVSFWGNQVDRRYSVDRIVPWGETSGGHTPHADSLFHHLEITGRKKPFYYSLKWGTLKNSPMLSSLLYLPEELGGQNERMWRDAYSRAANSHRKRQ